MHDSQVLTRWDNSEFDPTYNNACGVGSAHNKTINLICDWQGMIVEVTQEYA